MTREGILKENIDGEAVLWAVERLELSRAKKKFLFILTDGAPMDDSTLSVNPAPFLPKHLQAVASWLSGRSDLTVFAIGIEFAVSAYFQNSVTIKKLDSLGLPILKTVSDALKS